MTRLHRISVSTDIEGYSRTGPDGHSRLQNILFGAIDTALGAALGDRAEACGRQPQGDAELTVLPPGIDEGTVLRVLLAELGAALRRANAPLRDDRRVRVRVGVDAGAVGTGPGGFTGDSPISACRLRDSGVARTSLEESSGDYVVLVADRLYRDVLAPALDGDPQWSFKGVAVTAKNFQEMGWLHVPVHGPPRPPLGPPGGGYRQETGGLL